jgi:Holliday junction resolvase
MSTMQRTKGAAAEREVCALLRDMTGKDYARNLDQTRDSGGDIVAGRYLLEVKRQERLCIDDWWRQAVNSADEALKVPVVVFRRSRQAWRVVITLNEFVRLAREEL